ncbi:uncharacterized protein LOC120341703 [Styela clava]
MGCGTSTSVVVEGDTGSKSKDQQKNGSNTAKNVNTNNKSNCEITLKAAEKGLNNTKEISSNHSGFVDKSYKTSPTQNGINVSTSAMSAKVGMMASHEAPPTNDKSFLKDDVITNNDNMDKENKNTLNDFQENQDSNNNSAPESTVNATNETSTGEADEDDFDMTSAPLSRTDMLKHRQHATQETLEFVYKNSTKIAPPNSSDLMLSGGLSPYTGHRMNHRRGSGVPPPPRELKSTDFLARKAAAISVSMEEGDEDDDNV